MKRTTFFADEQHMDELKEIAREERKTLASVVREATALYVREKRKKKKRTLLEILRSCPDPKFFERLEKSRQPTDYGRSVQL